MFCDGIFIGRVGIFSDFYAMSKPRSVRLFAHYTRQWTGFNGHHGSLTSYMLVIIVCFLVALSSCSHEQSRLSETTFTYNEPNGITSLDPARAGYQAAIWAGTQIYNGLVERDSNSLIVPCIAESWQSDPTGTRWEFRLRRDVAFHDDACFGSARTRLVTAKDVEYSFLRLLDVRTKSPGLWVFQKRIKGAESCIEQTRRGLPPSCEGIRCMGDSIIQIDLTQPFAPFLQLLSMPYAWIIPREAVEYYGEEFSRHPVGTGPFRMDHWTPDIELVLQRNPRYFKIDKTGNRLPYMESVVVTFVRDTKTEFMEFRKGKLDVLSALDPSIATAVVNSDGTLQRAFAAYSLQQVCAESIEYYGILLDTACESGKASPLSRSALVRQALNYAIDRERIVRYVLHGKGVPAHHGVIPPGMPGFSPEVHGYRYNPDRARMLLTKAGYPGGAGLPAVTLQMGNSARTVSVGEAIQQMWKEIGVTVNLKQVDFPQHLEMVSASKLALWRTSWIGDYSDPENFLALFASEYFSPSGPNTTHYKRTSIDSLYGLIASSPVSSEQRYRWVHEAERQILEDCPWVFLYYPVIQRLVQPNVTGLPIDGSDRLVLERVRKIRSTR